MEEMMLSILSTFLDVRIMDLKVAQGFKNSGKLGKKGNDFGKKAVFPMLS